MVERIAAIPDLHCPYVNKEKISILLNKLDELKPTIIVQLGDLYDYISFSAFDKKIKMYDSVTEVLQGRSCAEELWSAVNNRCKKAKKVQLLGNHDIRPLKRLTEKSPELEPFIDISEYFKFKGVETILDPRDTFEVNDILFTHGHFSKLGQHVSNYHKSVVLGHTHRGGVLPVRLGGPNRDNLIFEVWSGYLANPYHEALIYRPLRKYFNWHCGFSWWDNTGPRFIPL